MGSMIKKVVLGAALVAGTLGVAATQANAERVRIAIGGPAAYIPPCPGVGYTWVAGYYDGGAWTPGFWRFEGPRYVARPGFVQGPYFYDRDRGLRRDRDDFDRDRNRDDRDRGRDHDRGFRPEPYRR